MAAPRLEIWRAFTATDMSEMTDSSLGAPAAIVLDAVEKHFGDHVVLKNVSLSVGAGQVFALIGPSGQARAPCCDASTCSNGRRLEPSLPTE